MTTGLITRYANGDYQEETRRLAVVHAATHKLPVVRPLRDEITFGTPANQQWLFTCCFCGVIWFIWFLVMLYLFT